MVPRLVLLARGFVGQLIILLDAGLGFRLTPLGPLAHPVEFAGEVLFLVALGLGFLTQALLLLLQPRGIVALKRDTLAAVHLKNPAGDVVEEVPVVRDADDGAGVLVQEALQPRYGFRIEVVGRLIKQQQVGARQQQATERHAALLTAGEVINRRIRRRTAQGVHGDFERAVQIPAVGGVDLLLQLAHFHVEVVHGVVVGIRISGQGNDFVEAVEDGFGLRHCEHDVLTHGQGRVELRLLRQVADLGTLRRPGFAVVLAVQPGHDLHEGGFTGTVQADDADLRAGQEAQVHVLEDFLAAREHLPQAFHDIDVLIAGHCAAFPAFLKKGVEA